MTCTRCERIFPCEFASCPVDGAELVGASDRPAPAAPGDDLRAGQTVGEYVIEATIGRGGMGSVYRATHPTIGSRVAIKVLSKQRLHDASAIARFVQEARAANQIRHRNIIDVFAFGKLADGRVYCVMEHLDGVSLARHLRNNGRMPLAEALCVLEQVARALDASHAKGVIHRDVKPGNIFLVRDPESGQLFVKLLDFGIAKLTDTPDSGALHTMTGMIMGTPAYMSPEQCRAKDVGPATDAYALGVVAYQMLAGVLPFPADNVAELLVLQQMQRPPALSAYVPAFGPTVDAVLERALHKDAAARYETASAFVRALAGAASQAVWATTPVDDLEPRTIAGPRRSRWLMATLGCSIAIATVIAMWPATSVGRSDLPTPTVTAKSASQPPVREIEPPAPEVASDEMQPPPPNRETTVASAPPRIEVAPAHSTVVRSSPSKPVRRVRRAATQPAAGTPRARVQAPAPAEPPAPANKRRSREVIPDMPVRF